MTKPAFNIRVYGILINEAQVLITHEVAMGQEMTKFPGGGLEYGEGIADCMKREFLEELGINIHILEHFYTTDFFVKSAFDNRQIVSIYYLVQADSLSDIEGLSASPDENIKLQWMPLNTIEAAHFTFPIDKHVADLLKTRFAKQ